MEIENESQSALETLHRCMFEKWKAVYVAFIHSSRLEKSRYVVQVACCHGTLVMQV